MTVCAMTECTDPATTILCATHTQRVVDDPHWNPGYVRDGLAHCGFCHATVVVLKRNGEPDPRRYILEWDSHAEGRCIIEDGGFSVADEGRQHAARRWGTPLYREHPPRCPSRPTVTGTVVDSVTG